MGNVYALTNEAMPGLVKIGKTDKRVEDRMKELFKTGVPIGFECLKAISCKDYERVEKQLHAVFADRRVSDRREFFRIGAAQVLAAMGLITGKDVTPRTELTDEEGRQIPTMTSQSNRHFSFNSAHVPMGSILTFLKNEEITAIVVDDNHIDFRGETMSLSRAGLIAVHECDYTWTKIAGPNFWVYEGETVKDRQERLLEESAD